VTKVDELLSH